MPNRKMDAIQVKDAIVAEKWALSPGFELFGQGLVEAAHRAGAGCHSHQFFRDFPDLMCACATDKPLRQCFRYLRFIPAIPLKDLRLELPLTISGHGEVLNAPGLGHQVSCVRAVAIPFSLRGAFSPRCTEALLQLLSSMPVVFSPISLFEKALLYTQLGMASDAVPVCASARSFSSGALQQEVVEDDGIGILCITCGEDEGKLSLLRYFT